MTVLFGSFHIIALIISCMLAAAAAWFLRGVPSSGVTRISFVVGIILAAMEVYKQLFITFSINNGVYDWWFFPFQLCSLPMYLCILLPFVPKQIKSAFFTFMASYTFISAMAALIFPEDFLRSQLRLTLHGFIWHGLLLFISLLIIFSRSAGLTAKGFIGATVVFVAGCAIAICINVLAEPIMSSAVGIEHSYAAMFYMNPFHISPQPLVGTIQKSTNIPLGLVLYAFSIIAASGLLLIILRHLIKAKRTSF